ncbi:zeta toxin family protein [Nocardia sp. NPDC003963]
MEGTKSAVAAVACQGLGRIRDAVHLGTDKWSRTGHDFAHHLRSSAQRYRLSDRDMRFIFEREIIPQHLEIPVGGGRISERPTVTAVVGQPGAGKSVTIRAIADSFRERGGAVRLIADDYMRHHPDFAELRARDDFTAGDHLYPIAERWLDMAIDHVIAQRRHAVLEEGAGDPVRTARVILRFQRHTYRSVVDAIAVPRAESEASVLTRFLRERLRDGTGRYVPVAAQHTCLQGSADLIRALESDRPPVAVDELRVRSRSEILFDNHRMAQGEWTEPPAGWDALQTERDRPPTPDEVYAHFERIERFRETLAQANADEPGQGMNWQRLLIEMEQTSRLLRS